MIDIQEDNRSDNLGYDVCDWDKNGELLCLRHFLADTKKELVVYDIGANDGEWTCAALQAGKCTVYAFEPSGELYQQFIQRINKTDMSSRVNGNCYGLGAIQSVRTLYVSKGKTPGQKRAGDASSVYEKNVMQHNDVTYYEQPYTEFKTLDYYAGFRSDHIDFLKIDVEGMELEVLKGSTQMLTNRAIDVIQFEYGPKYPAAGATLQQVYDLLTQYDFELYRIIPTGLLHIPAWRDELECRRFCNYIAIRKGVKREWRGI